ncbi:hypothetical protein B0J11DRAFT_560654 [Dendryphion nanum]|uniref:DUF1750-domain-containing protein n=1 Tax=Dendryphion nanum TaxID=256645 RepID=A0A9P9DGX1_9PLEO|nr:hypothetical protein B0J11DRAFT_560654 [Dendryphion nanum]
MYAMNQNHAPGNDPSALVPNQIVPHVHLVSIYRFAQSPSLQPQQALDYLLKGPAIVKDTAPVAWTYFQSPPPDGTILLTWQPPRMPQEFFASDGLVWADNEVRYEMSIRGYTLQVLIHKSGFHYPHESVTAHARYRYRITQGPGHFDPYLYIVHYAAADANSRLPAAQIPLRPDVQATISQRNALQTAGQLIRKEFMLADRANWPRVEFSRSAVQQPAFYNPMNPMQQQRPAQPPTKRQRVAQQQRAAPPEADQSIEEEENSTQDSFDHLTPREISLSRYKQHHEWMEEIFSSPYAIGKIMPIDLGLGLMGELAPLTAGILDVPGGDHPLLSFEREQQVTAPFSQKRDYEVKSYTKLNPDQLKEFETRVTQFTSKEEAELAKLKASHEKKMANLKRDRTYIKAERRLRDLPRSREYASPKDGAELLDGVVHELEKSLGVEFDTKAGVVCVEKGGFIEEQEALAQKGQQNNSNNTVSNGNNGPNGIIDTMDGENSAAGLLDQYGSNSLTGTPGENLSVPQTQPPSQSQSAVATPSAPVLDANHVPATADSVNAESLDNTNDLLDLDVEMSGMTNAQEGGAETDWVMVDNTTAQQPATSGEPPATTSAPAPSTSAATVTASADAEASTGLFDTADFGSFDGLDTAGDALADYANDDDDDDNLGLDLVDDSAFGDAFHGTEMHHGEQDNDGS